MIRELRCCVLVCDGCGRVCEHGEDYTPHFVTAWDARDGVQDLDWTRDGDLDRCPGCTCASRGHDWFTPLWAPDPPGPCRCCRRRGRVEPAPAEGLDSAAGGER